MSVTYSITGARSREIIVDGLEHPGAVPAKGRVDLRVHCDAVEHTVAIVAVDAAGVRTTKVAYLNTRMAIGVG